MKIRFLNLSETEICLSFKIYKMWLTYKSNINKEITDEHL